jgi:hypothetical protein
MHLEGLQIGDISVDGSGAIFLLFYKCPQVLPPRNFALPKASQVSCQRKYQPSRPSSSDFSSVNAQNPKQLLILESRIIGDQYAP